MTSGFANITFDDRNTTFLHYTGGWFTTGSWNATSVGQTGTLTSTLDTTANVTFSFPVPARAFYYYGIPRCCGGMYAICIDCEPTAPSFEPIDAVNRTDNGQNPPTVLYSKTWDRPGLHEIILTNQPDPRFEGSSQITVDRFELEVVDEDAQSSVSPAQSTNTFPSSATTDASSAAIPPGPPRPPVGAIAGGTVGGFVLLSLLLGLCFFLGRRRRRKDMEAGRRAGPRSAEPYAIDNSPSFPPDMRQELLSPFPYLSQDPHHDPQQGYLGRKAAKASGSTGGATQSAFQSTLDPSSTFVSASGSALTLDGTFPHSQRTMGHERSGPRFHRRETDAGRVEVGSDDDNDDARTLPPEYDQVFRRSRDERGQPPLPRLGTHSNGPYGTLTSQSQSSPVDSPIDSELPPQRKS